MQPEQKRFLSLGILVAFDVMASVLLLSPLLSSSYIDANDTGLLRSMAVIYGVAAAGWLVVIAWVKAARRSIIAFQVLIANIAIVFLCFYGTFKVMQWSGLLWHCRFVSFTVRGNDYLLLMDQHKGTLRQIGRYFIFDAKYFHYGHGAWHQVRNGPYITTGPYHFVAGGAIDITGAATGNDAWIMDDNIIGYPTRSDTARLWWR